MQCTFAADGFMSDSLRGFFECHVERNHGNGSGGGFHPQGMALKQEDIIRVATSTLADDNTRGGTQGKPFRREGATRREYDGIPRPVLVAAVQELRHLSLSQTEQKPEVGPRIGDALQVLTYPVEFNRF